MPRFSVIARVLIVVPAMASALAFELEPEEVFKRVAPSVVVIEVFNRAGVPQGLGSGVVISSREIVTNCHVVQQAIFFRIKRGNREVRGKLRFADEERDLC